MKWFETYGEISIMVMIWLVYVLFCCLVPLTIVRFILAMIGSFAIGLAIAKVSFWLRDKIIEVIKDGGFV